MKVKRNELSALRRLLRLKNVLRAGWTRHDIPSDKVESVADHSYGVALLSLLLCPAELDKTRVLELALLHDVAEIEVGDITPHDGISSEEKRQRELSAARDLLGGLSEGESLLKRFYEVTDAESPEARFVKAIDKLEMALQSLNYQDEFELDLSEFRRTPPESLVLLGVLESDLSHEVPGP